MPSASPTKRRYALVPNTPPLLIIPVANRNNIGKPLLCAEIGFLVVLVALTSIYVTQVCTIRRTTPAPVAPEREEFGYPPQCLPHPVQAGSSGAIPRSSFTVLEWTSTGFSPMSSFQHEDTHQFGPSALLDEDTTVSCFTFAGSRGGAVLVSNSEKYYVTQFTLNNSMVDALAGSGYYPKGGALWGLFEGELPHGLENATTSFVAEDAIYVLIGSFCFDPEWGSVQTFATEAYVTAFPAVKFSAFYLEVLSNWGGSHTCVCRLTLHGNP